jgi:serine/threonine protein kinase
MRALKGHPDIVGLNDVYVTTSQVQLVMELVQGGELFDYLVENGPYSEAADRFLAQLGGDRRLCELRPVLRLRGS